MPTFLNLTPRSTNAGHMLLHELPIMCDTMTQGAELASKSLVELQGFAQGWFPQIVPMYRNSTKCGAALAEKSYDI